MKIIIKAVSVLAILLGFMAVITGSRVLLGLFDPGYQFFTILIGYNIILGVVSIIAGIVIWKQKNKALFLSAIIAGLHTVVLLLLITIFKDIVSTNSMIAMTVRSGLWIVFSVIILKSNLFNKA